MYLRVVLLLKKEVQFLLYLLLKKKDIIWMDGIQDLQVELK